ncbi:hypothetical protein HYT26_03600 [Candidatus Pacearchaeota archaeon]|nr:hypothetical protein [Candidatus Pacearchaeota archaeon]
MRLELGSYPIDTDKTYDKTRKIEVASALMKPVINYLKEQYPHRKYKIMAKAETWYFFGMSGGNLKVNILREFLGVFSRQIVKAGFSFYNSNTDYLDKVDRIDNLRSLNEKTISQRKLEELLSPIIHKNKEAAEVRRFLHVF